MNIPGTNIYFQPTIEEVCSGYARVGFTKAEAVKAVVALRLKRGQNHGHGNRAAKREGVLSTMSDERLARSMEERDIRLHAALCYDQENEARAFPAKPSPHDE